MNYFFDFLIRYCLLSQTVTSEKEVLFDSLAPRLLQSQTFQKHFRENFDPGNKKFHRVKVAISSECLLFDSVERNLKTSQKLTRKTSFTFDSVETNAHKSQTEPPKILSVFDPMIRYFLQSQI